MFEIKDTTEEETETEMNKIVDEIKNAEFWNDNEFVRTKVTKVYYDATHNEWYEDGEEGLISGPLHN